MDDNLNRLKIRLQIENDEHDALLMEILRSASAAVVAKSYPYAQLDDVSHIERRYQDQIVRIAVVLYGNMGAEGQVSHSENGISRTWDGASGIKPILDEIPSACGVY